MNDLTLESARAIHRRRFIQLSAGSLAAVAAGCHPRDAATHRRSTLIIATPDGERGMNAIDEADAKNLVFLPLIIENDTGELEGRLAERWEHSPDYQDWTIHLRKNIRWHDAEIVHRRVKGLSAPWRTDPLLFTEEMWLEDLSS